MSSPTTIILPTANTDQIIINIEKFHREHLKCVLKKSNKIQGTSGKHREMTLFSRKVTEM